MRVKYDVMKTTLKNILIQKGFAESISDEAAIIFTDSSCDGVYSHGLNRFPRVLDDIDKGVIKVDASPKIVSNFGAIEVVDGQLGLGVINATFCMDRAIKLSKTHGIGCVAIRDNNHWMRGATYGLQAAKAGVIGVCFTNTTPNMPAWGGKDNRLGNNPLIIAVPNGERGIILDLAMSQFSYGKMEDLASKDMTLSQYGGYNLDGELSIEPKEILASQRPLPIGFWKGSGLSLVLDILASILSSGDSTQTIGYKKSEYGVSQVFIAIDPEKTSSKEMILKKIEETIAYVKDSEPIRQGNEIYYPGEQSQKRREENLRDGIPVNEEIWMKLASLY